MIEWWALHGAEIKGLLWYGYWLGLGIIGAAFTYGLVFWAVGEAKQIAFNVRKEGPCHCGLYVKVKEGSKE